MQSVELIITLACIVGFGILVLIGFICLKKKFRLKWEHCCDVFFTCGGKYPSEKTVDLQKQEARAGGSSHHRQNNQSVLNASGRKRPEEIQPLASAVESGNGASSQLQAHFYEGDDIDIEAGNDDMPIVRSSLTQSSSGRHSTGSNSRQLQQQPYFSSSTQRTITTTRTQTGRSTGGYRDRDILVADDDEATL